MSVLQLPLSMDDLELAWLKESYAEGYGKLGKVIAQRNYIRNPSVEVDLANIGSLLGAVLNRDTATKFSGTASLRVDTPGVAVSEGAFFSGTLLANGDTFSAAVRFMGENGVPFVAQFRTTYTDLSISQNVVNFVADGTWQLINSTAGVTVDPAKVVATIQVVVRINTILGTTFWLDNAVLSKGTTPPAYMDGSTADNAVYTYDWEGAANNSSSIKWSRDPILVENLVRNPEPWISGSFTGMSGSGGVSFVSDSYLGFNAIKVTAGVEVTRVATWMAISDTTLAPVKVGFKAAKAPGTAFDGIRCILYDSATATIRASLVILGISADKYTEYSGVMVPTGTYDQIYYTVTSSTNGVVPGHSAYIRDMYAYRGGDFSYGYFDPYGIGAAGTGTTWALFDVNARSIGYLEKAYWASRSGLIEPKSLNDHKLAALRANIRTVVGDPLPVVRRNGAYNPKAEYSGVGVGYASQVTGGVLATFTQETVAPPAGFTTYYRSVVTDAGVAGVNRITATISTPGIMYPIDATRDINYRCKGYLNRNVLVGVYATFYDITRTYITQLFVSFNTSNGVWVDCVGVATPPANAAYTVFSFGSAGNAVLGDDLRATGFLIDQDGSTYFDGDTSNLTVWQGVDEKSFSEMVDGSKSTIGDLWVSYLMSRSGLTPASKWSLADHELAFYKAQLGL